MSIDGALTRHEIVEIYTTTEVLSNDALIVDLCLLSVDCYFDRG